MLPETLLLYVVGGAITSITSIAIGALFGDRIRFHQNVVLARVVGSMSEFIATGRLIREFKGHSRAVLAVAFCPDGKTALSSGQCDLFKLELKLWNLVTGGIIRELRLLELALAACEGEGRA